MEQLAGVAAVFILLGVAVWWLRRSGFAAGARPTAARVRLTPERIGRLALGPQHRLELVRLADRVMVLAVHSSGCSLLETLPWREVAPEAGAPPAEVSR